jgi:hypothetical protein
MKVKWIFLSNALFLVLLALAGCSSSQFPSGEFTSQLEGQEITLRFDGDGNFVLLRNGREYAGGTYSVEGNQLTWLTDSSCAAPNGETATYSWILENQTLTFSLVEKDSCMSRLYMFEKLPYEKRP